MKKLIAGAVAAVMISSCGVSTPLYYWGGTQSGTTAYENLAYKSYDKQTPKSICSLVVLYEEMVSNPGGTRAVPPPGICAEYGYLLLKPETAECFLNHATAAQKKVFGSANYDVLFLERGKEMLQKEIELYPESARFIEPLIKKLAR